MSGDTISPSPFRLRRREDMSRDDLRQGNRFATAEAYNSRLHSKSSHLECVGVGEGKDGYVYLFCTDCGNLFHKSKSKIRPSRTSRIVCPYCEQVLWDISKQDRAKLLEKKKEQKIIEKQNKLIEKENSKHRKCVRCGKEFIRTGKEIYCSAICMRRQADSTRTHIRRMQAKSKVHDVISLEMLYKRDRGICWLCGEATDWRDKVTRKDGTVIVHGNYPSIDHVTPLAKGGTHTWDNVRLAHHKCNSLKGANLTVEKKNGQMMFVI